MSPRAACRLEAIGFEAVYDYTAGIADWKAADLPVEGTEDSGLRIADATRPDIPTALPDEMLGTVRQQASEAGWDEALVVECDGLVIGRLRGAAWSTDESEKVDAVMELGPTTVRPDGSLHSLLGRLDKRGTKLVVVSDPKDTSSESCSPTMPDDSPQAFLPSEYGRTAKDAQDAGAQPTRPTDTLHPGHLQALNSSSWSDWPSL